MSGQVVEPMLENCAGMAKQRSLERPKAKSASVRRTQTRRVASRGRSKQRPYESNGKEQQVPHTVHKNRERV